MSKVFSFERFAIGLGIVFLASALVWCAGCGGAEFSSASGEGIGESEAGGDDAKPGSLPEAGDDLRDSSSSDGMASLHRDSGVNPDGAQDSAPLRLCDGSATAALFCCAVDPGPGVYCHNWPGAYCADIPDAGSGAADGAARPCGTVLGSACASDPDPGMPCPGTVCGWDQGVRCE